MSFETGWNTLEELRDAALAAGCTPAQFNEAVETIGDDPHGVANYLQRYVLNRQDNRRRRAS